MQTIKVRLRKPRRVLTFLCDGVHLLRDDTCIVESDRGQEWGICVLPPEPCLKEMEGRYSMHVLRKTQPDDEATRDQIREDERRAKELCAGKIRKRGLPMKLVDVEYTFDKQKVVFYFTADDRVDFRELVRDLAHELRTRIELRHNQVRDEAKIVGGIGSCGRQLCCSTFLDEFKPISMRMAKRQNLSLNPSKISGQCGRLLCCLEYENSQYETPRRRPKETEEKVVERPKKSEPAPGQWVDKPEKDRLRPPPAARQKSSDASPKPSRPRKDAKQTGAPRGKDTATDPASKQERKPKRRRRRRKGNQGGGQSKGGA